MPSTTIVIGRPPLGLAPQSTGTPRRRSSGRSSIISAVSEGLSEADDIDPDEGLDRKTVRLDGLEVYAVVSAVTAGTLVAVFDSYHPGDIVDLVSSGRFLEALMSIIFLVTGSVGIVCGLHCIFVFSLITMYGRTALGMERDDALEDFFGGTGLQRYHGFKTFVGSLYALMCELIVVITSKISSNPAVHIAALLATAKLMHYVYIDTQSIMEKAGVIFAPPKQPDVEGDVPKDGEERMGLLNGHSSDVDEDDDGIATSNHSSARNTGRTIDRRKSLTKRGSVMNVPATELISSGGGGGKGGFRKGSLSSAESTGRRISNFSRDDAGSNADDDSYMIQQLHEQMERRGTNESRDSVGPLRRRTDRSSAKRSSTTSGGRGRGGRRSLMMRKHQSTMNVAATDLLDS